MTLLFLNLLAMGGGQGTAGPPYSVAAAQTFTAGAVYGETFIVGATAGETYTAGAEVGEVNS